MEREVARVAAACALRAFRYIPFLALKFDPIPIASEGEAEAATAPPVSEPPPPAIPAPTPVIQPEAVALAAPPLPAGSMTEQVSKPALVPQPAPIVIAQPPPVAPAAAPPVSAPPGRRYRMLEELAPASEPEPEAGVVAPRPAGRSAPRPAMPALPGGAATRPSSSALHSPRPRGATPRRAWPG